jgi:NTE family protein
MEAGSNGKAAVDGLLRLPSLIDEPQQRRPSLAVVLGGGGSRGAYEVGVVDALASAGIIPDMLVGTSVGAINAAFWALNPTRDAGRRLLDVWLETDRSLLAPEGWLQILPRLIRGQDHLAEQRALLRALRRGFMAHATLEQSDVPLVLVATDLVSGQIVHMTNGPLMSALLASTAVPGVYPAVPRHGRTLVDGALVANVDFQAAVEAGMTDVIAVDLVGSALADHPLSLRAVLERTVELVLRRQTDLALAEAKRKLRVVVLRPQFVQTPGFSRLDWTRELFDAGRLAAVRLIASHLGPDRRVVPGIVASSTPLRRCARETMPA